MSKIKYHYNPNTLKYERVERTFKTHLKNLLWFVAFAIVFGTAGGFIVLKFVESPIEKSLRIQISDLTSNYNLLRLRANQIDKVLESLRERDNAIYRVIFEANPIDYEALKPHFLDTKKYEKLSSSQYYSLIAETGTLLDSLSKKMYVQSKSYDFLVKEVKNKNKMTSSIPAIQPVSNKDLKRIASGFGYRLHPIYKTLKLHAGIDFSAPTGTDIYATGDGVVIKAGTVRGYGNTVIIDHGYGYRTLYAHMSKLIARAGQRVKRGQIIGKVGNTGVSTAPHLHYEVRKNNTPVDPINFFFNDLTPEEYEKVRVIASRHSQSFD